MDVCYWCGQNVLNGEGAKEHIIPRTILQDADDDTDRFIISKLNAHKCCNKFLADTYEHDFCQIIFNYSYEDQKATKHVESKIRNLKSKPDYLLNQFKKVKRKDGLTTVDISDAERTSFKMCVKKIVKGLYFKEKGSYLDVDKNYVLRIIWNTMNLEHDDGAKNQVIQLLSLLDSVDAIGNSVFKYRHGEVEGAQSSFWELLFYGRFPVYVFLIHNQDKHAFRSL